MDVFLLIITFAYLSVASVQDLRKREVWNWLSFSLVILALAYRAFYAVVYSDLWFFALGVLGFLAFTALGYGCYYARIFAGGDAKLLFAVGACLPEFSIASSLAILIVFSVLMLFAGSIYGMTYSFFLVLRNREKFSSEFLKQFKKYKKFVFLSAFLALLIIPFAFREGILLVFPALVFLLPFLYIYGKSVEKSCMIQSVYFKELTIGDWLYENVKVRGKIIKPNWEGLSEKEVELLKKNRGKVKIKVGIPFVPGFLIAYLALIVLRCYGFWGLSF